VSCPRGLLRQQDLVEYGWRLPFLLALPFGVLGVWLFSRLKESDEYRAAHREGKLHHNPITVALCQWWPRTLVVVAVAALWASTFYTVFIWSQHFMDSLVEPAVPHPFAVSLVGILFLCCVFPFAGALSDSRRPAWLPLVGAFEFGRVETMLVGGAGLVIFTIPLFALLTVGSDVAALASFLGFAVLLALWGAPMCSWMVESFPLELR
jgi:MHS family proline/betaine transporter-like MFS transporter